MASRSYKTEAVVLRSIRFGEADRVLHLYTAERGRVGAVAKGVRKTKSRVGGRGTWFCPVCQPERPAPAPPRQAARSSSSRPSRSRRQSSV